MRSVLALMLLASACGSRADWPHLHCFNRDTVTTEKGLLDNCHGDVLLVDGHLYGSSCRSGGKIFFCAEFPTGKVVKSENLRKMSLTWADGHLYGVSDRGLLMLMKTRPGGYDIISKLQLPRRKGQLYLAHPVVLQGRLYIRYANELNVYDISNNSKT